MDGRRAPSPPTFEAPLHVALTPSAQPKERAHENQQDMPVRPPQGVPIMTWGQFKLWVDSQGIPDDMEISYMDWSYSPEDAHIEKDLNGNPVSFYVW